jgi:hypothetical protein
MNQSTPLQFFNLKCNQNYRYIAVEFASIWRGMGAAVDLFYRSSFL